MKRVSCIYSEGLAERLKVKVSPVLVGVKPAVLFPLAQRPGRCCGWKEACCNRDNFCGLEFCYLTSPCGRGNILVYDRVHLERILTSQGNKQFLDSFGYAECLRCDEYLDVLAQRFRSGGFPHEIGVFLGYPLKDVRGFVVYGNAGAVPLRGRWKIYDEPRESLSLMKLYTDAERAFEKMFSKKKDPIVFLEPLARHFGGRYRKLGACA